ncbi:MAG: SBBP repeat-containing protein, partial [Candidatus Kapaibacterium sp.]
MKSQPIRRSNPLLFQENRGQIVDAKGDARPDILYSVEARGVGLFLRHDGFSYVFSSSPDRPSDERKRRELLNEPSATGNTAYRMDLQFIGANPGAVVTAEESSGTFSNYYLPHCRDGITGVPAWQRITYHNIYPEIDLVLHCVAGRIYYDFIVRPGGRVSDIRLRYSGADSVSRHADGSLVASNLLGFVREESPRTYQIDPPRGNSAEYFSGDTTIISSDFDPRGSEFRFRVDRYDSLATLVIDPGLDWATYVGGSDQDGWYPMNSGNSWGQAPVIDKVGLIVMGGITSSVNFPVTPGALQSGNAGGKSDFYIIKIDSVGRLIWSTYLGGGDQDILYGICGDYHGNIGITGSTRSSDFPVKSAYQSTPGGSLNMVIASLDGDGKMRWSTYYGGAGESGGGGIAADRGGTFYVAGTAAADFPLIASTRPQFLDPINIAMISITNIGTPTRAILYGRASRYLGPSSFAVVVSGVAVDNVANVSITGSVGGLAGDSSFAVSPNAFQTIHAGASIFSPNGDAFIIQFDSDFKRRWATLYGGRASDIATCIAATQLGDVVIAGTTNGDDFPTSPDGFQRLFTGTDMAFVVKFDRNGKQLWGTMYGGGAENRFNSVVFAPDGAISVVGHTTSTDFPITTDAYLRQKPTTSRFATVIVSFDSNGTRTWSSYYVGVGNNTYGTGVAVDSLGRLYAAGLTTDNLPGTDLLPVFQPRFGGTEDAFIARFGPVCLQPTISVTGQKTLCVGDSVVLTASDPQTPATVYKWLPTGESTRSITFHAPPGISSLDIRVSAFGPGGCADTSEPVHITVHPPPVVNILPAGPLRICKGDSVQLSTSGGGLVAWRWSNGGTAQSIWADSLGTYTVDVTDTNGCSGRASVVVLPPLPPPVIAQSDTLFLCSGDTLTLDAGSGYSSYVWEDGSTGQTHRVQKSGKYVVIIGTGGSCQASDSVEVVVGATVTPIITPSGPTLLCAGDSVTLDAGPGYAAYKWSTNDSTQRITVRQAGKYHVTVTAGGGCGGTSADLSVIVRPPLSVAITPPGPLAIPPGDSVTLDAGPGYASYKWSTGA